MHGSLLGKTILFGRGRGEGGHTTFTSVKGIHWYKVTYLAVKLDHLPMGLGYNGLRSEALGAVLFAAAQKSK